MEPIDPEKMEAARLKENERTAKAAEGLVFYSECVEITPEHWARLVALARFSEAVDKRLKWGTSGTAIRNDHFYNFGGVAGDENRVEAGEVTNNAELDFRKIHFDRPLEEKRMTGVIWIAEGENGSVQFDSNPSMSDIRNACQDLEGVINVFCVGWRAMDKQLLFTVPEEEA